MGFNAMPAPKQIRGKSEGRACEATGLPPTAGNYWHAGRAGKLWSGTTNSSMWRHIASNYQQSPTARSAPAPRKTRSKKALKLVPLELKPIAGNYC